jgi:hypothetical protein
MKPTHKIIDQAQVHSVHANANFGEGVSMRSVVDEGVLQYALGYSTGHTQMVILQEHGLINRPRAIRQQPVLSAKGKRYLRAMFHNVPLDKILFLRGDDE